MYEWKFQSVQFRNNWIVASTGFFANNVIKITLKSRKFPSLESNKASEENNIIFSASNLSLLDAYWQLLSAH